MAEKFRSACPLDCWDACAFLITKEGEKVVKIEGDPEHEITQGFICPKGRKHLERVYHPERILYPLQKVKDKWERISWEKALKLIADKLENIKRDYGSTAVLHYYDCGSGGLLKDIDQLFFNLYGGVSKGVGSLCWAAGIAAQKYDFGLPRSHHPKDMENSKIILIWGRNPVETNIHLVPYLKKAQKKGTKLVTIDPIKTPTAVMSDFYFQPRPGTDGALALGLANILLRDGWADVDFVDNHSLGFPEYRNLLVDYPLERTAEITGLKEEEILQLARLYGQNKPGCIIIGYGMQRYTNSGQAVRAIDALAAMTGNIGIPGGGANYANFLASCYYDYQILEGDKGIDNYRYFPKSKTASFIEQAEEPPIKAAFVVRSNPVIQIPDTNHFIEAFQQVDFKVVIDMFMTDTAKLADLILPCTSFLEEENIISTSMGHGYMNYMSQVIQPLGEAKTEYEIFQSLAAKMGLKDFPQGSSEELIKKVLQPITEKFGLTLEMLKEKSYALPEYWQIPWENKVFLTPSKKFEFSSQGAAKEAGSPLPVFQQTAESLLSGEVQLDQLYFLTPHPKDSLHSQHYIFQDRQTLPKAYLSSKRAAVLDIAQGDYLEVSSSRGKLKCVASLEKEMREDILMVYEGWWLGPGGTVNMLTSDGISDMGLGAIYYDCICQVKNLSK